jgi:hypothetical protein
MGVAGEVTLLSGRRTGLSKLPKRGLRIRHVTAMAFKLAASFQERPDKNSKFKRFLTEYLQSVISNVAWGSFKRQISARDIKKFSLIVTCCSCLLAPVVRAATSPFEASPWNSLALKEPFAQSTRPTLNGYISRIAPRSVLKI